MTIRVAVTGISGDAGLGAVRGLLARHEADEDLWILGFDWSDDCPGRHLVDSYMKLPPVADVDYVDVLSSQLCAHSIDVLLPGVDAETIILSRHRNRLSDLNTQISIAPADLVEAADDKLATTAFLTARGIGAPATCDARSPMDLGFPVVAKPRRGQGGRGVSLLPDARSLDAFLKERRSGYCLQKYVGGPEITVGFLYDWNGVLCDAVAMERVLVDGRTVRATVLRSPEILRFMEHFGSQISGAGAVNAQLRMDPDQGPKVFEINARLSGSTAMRVAVGFNDPLRIAKHLARGARMERANVRNATIYSLPSELVVASNE